MRLMRRERHSLQPQPVSGSKGFDPAPHQPKPKYLGKVGEDHVFSKLLLCTPNEVVNLILQWERSELQAQLESEKDCPESCFIQQALELLAVRENTAIQCLSSFATALASDSCNKRCLSSFEINCYLNTRIWLRQNQVLYLLTVTYHVLSRPMEIMIAQLPLSSN